MLPKLVLGCPAAAASVDGRLTGAIPPVRNQGQMGKATVLATVDVRRRRILTENKPAHTRTDDPCDTEVLRDVGTLTHSILKAPGVDTPAPRSLPSPSFSLSTRLGGLLVLGAA